MSDSVHHLARCQHRPKTAGLWSHQHHGEMWPLSHTHCSQRGGRHLHTPVHTLRYVTASKRPSLSAHTPMEKNYSQPTCTAGQIIQHTVRITEEWSQDTTVEILQEDDITVKAENTIKCDIRSAQYDVYSLMHMLNIEFLFLFLWISLVLNWAIDPVSLHSISDSDPSHYWQAALPYGNLIRIFFMGLQDYTGFAFMSLVKIYCTDLELTSNSKICVSSSWGEKMWGCNIRGRAGGQSLFSLTSRASNSVYLVFPEGRRHKLMLFWKA